jgi:lipopolysaccharide exporter
MVWLAAPAVAGAFASTELTPLLRAMALTLPVSAASAVSLGLLSKAMDFGRLAALEITSYGLGFALVGVGCALEGLGVWSLVAATLVQQTTTLILAYAFTRHAARPRLTRSTSLLIWSYGSRYSLNGFLEFLGANLDTLFIGRLLGGRALGLYNRSMTLAALPLQSSMTVVSKVLFPALAAVQTERGKLARGYLVLAFLVAAVAGSTGIGMSIAADDVVASLLGPRWTEAQPVLGMLALAVPFGLLTHLCGIVCDAQAWLALKLRIQLATMGVLLIAIWGLHESGLIGFAIAVTIGEAFRAGVYAVAVGRRLGVRGPDAMPALLAATGVWLVTGGSVAAAKWLAPVQFFPWVRLGVEVCAGGASLAVALVAAWSILGRQRSFAEAEARVPILARVGRRGRAAGRLLRPGA